MSIPMSTDHRLNSFLTYVNNYLHTYRKRYNKLGGDVITLRYLVGGNDTVTIYCGPAEVEDKAFKVGDFWYSGAVLRKCIGIEVDDDGKQSRKYVVCYRYTDAFASTILSLNPTLNGGASLPPSVTQNPNDSGNMNQGDTVKTGGATMTGPLYLRSNTLDAREAAPKGYIDAIATRQQQLINELSTRVARAEASASATQRAMTQLKLDLEDIMRLRVIRVSKTTPASEWRVVHNHGSRFVIVQVYDMQGEKVEPDTIQVIDENALVIKFAVPVAGRACVFLPKELV